MHLLHSLPCELKRHIYTYDATYKDIFDNIIKLIPDTIIMYGLRETKKNKNGWDKLDSIFKLRNSYTPNRIFVCENIHIWADNNSFVRFLESKLDDFYGYNNNNNKFDWEYLHYNGRSIYLKSYIYPGLFINVYIYLNFEFQKYAPKSYISDKHLKRRVKRGRYMDMGHYQRREI